MDINVENVLSGTDQKKFDLAYNKMKENYNEDTAEELFQVYNEKSLAFILKNLDPILRESYFGAPLINEIVEKESFPLHLLQSLKDKILPIETKLDQMKKYEQKDQYFKLEETLNKLLLNYKNTIELANLCISMGAREYIETIYDYMYQIKTNGSDEEFNDLVSSINCSVPNGYVSAFVVILYLIMNVEEYQIAGKTTDGLQGWYPDIPNELREKEIYNFIRGIKIAGKDDEIVSKIQKMGVNIKYSLLGIITDKTSETKPELTQIKESTDIPIFSIGDFMTRLIEETVSESSDVKIERYDYLSHLKSYYESARDFISYESGIELDETFLESFDAYENVLSEIEAEMVALEWTDNGEPDPIIKQHIMTQKQIQKEKDDKKKKLNEEISKDEKDKPEEDKEENEEEEESEPSAKNMEFRDKILNLAKKTLESAKSPAHINTSSEDEFLTGKTNSICLGSFKEEDLPKAIKVLKQAFNTNKDVNIKEDNYRTIYLSIKKSSQFFFEATEEEEEKPEPIAPEEDFATKVQNKAIDHEAKRKEKDSIKKEKRTKLKNAAKAVSTGPKDKISGAKNFFSNFNKWDENRRKKFFLKPGFRHKLFRNARIALMYGGAARMKFTSIPWLMLFRHFSKDKDRRIRNEVIRELDSEIRITEEKISDANANGDQQEKYRLMRIKDKLTAEKQRVQLNSKYI